MRLTTPEISWHGKEPLFSLDFSLNNKSTRLATSGADSYIRIWAVHCDDDKKGSKVEFMANLYRHTKAVNVVRFSPKGNMLASGGDDCFVIIWKLNDDNTDAFPRRSGMESEDFENKESWQVSKMLRGHIEDVYDLAWSPNGTQLISGSVDNSVIIWDTNKGDKLRILKDHRQYVQGVSWDPCGTYVASYSCDRTCRIYNTSNYRCCYNINKVTLPNNAKTETGSQSSKQIKIFHDESMPSFFRRLTFSPDGLLLFVPGGKFEVQEKVVNTTFVFTKASMNKPVMYFPATKKPTIAVKCCPVLFKLRNTGKNSSECKKSVFKLPYRTVIAVASLDSVVLYDTQRTLPFGFLSNMHYASLTDIAWSGDGKILAISSRDGFCSLVTFEDNELGVPYSQTASEVIKNSTVFAKEISPNRRIITTPRSKTPDSINDERTPPKMEKLSIKNFVTVNAPKPNSSQSASVQSSVKTSNAPGDEQASAEPAPRRVGFVTVKPSMAVPCSTVSNSAAAMTTVSMATQPRRVNFTTLQAKGTGTSSLEQGEGTSKDTNKLNANSSTCEEVTPVSSTSENQPRRVEFVTIKSPQGSSVPHRSPTNPLSQSKSKSPPGGEEPVKSTLEPRRVNFVTLKPPQNSTAPQPEIVPTSTSTNDRGSGTSREGCASMTQSPPPIANVTTTEAPSTTTEKAIPQPSCTIHSTNMARANVKTDQDKTIRKDRPPVPLEPEVTIINH